MERNTNLGVIRAVGGREGKYKRALATGLLRASGMPKVLTFLTRIASASGPDP